jgi:predicted GIY-YIG superfamily endonuclease
MTGTTLYRLVGPDGHLLYVGIAGNPGRRFEQHAKDKPWWSTVTSVRLEHFDNRVEALEAERVAIHAEKPLHNIVHNKGGEVPLVVPEGAQGWSFASRRSGYERTESALWLYPELDCSSCVDDVWPGDGHEQFEYYVEYVKRRYPEWWKADAVPIYWSVRPIGETAPFRRVWDQMWSTYPQSRDFLTYFTWPVDVNGEPLDWFTMPVCNDRFPDFAKVLGWVPSPLQPTAPLRSIVEARP